MDNLVTAYELSENGVTTSSPEDIQQELQFFKTQVLDQAPANTKRAYLQSYRTYEHFLMTNGIIALPQNKHSLRQHILSYLDHLLERGDSRSTIKSRLWVMRSIHDHAGLPSVEKDPSLKKAMQIRLNTQRTSRQSQAKPLDVSLLQRITTLPYSDVGALRNKAIVNVAFDTLGRASEIAALQWHHIGENSILIERSKTDQEGLGRDAFLSKTSLRLLDELRPYAPLGSPYIFRPMVNHLQFDESAPPNEPIGYNAMLRALRSIVAMTGHKHPEAFSFHSTRVGGAVAMREAGISLLEIMQAGGWKSEAMVLRYTQAIDMKKSGGQQLSNQLNR